MIIGVSGKAQHGKDTAGHYLVKNYGFTRKAFADELKNIASELGWDGQKDAKGRNLLIELGRLGRDYNENCWVDLLKAELDFMADVESPMEQVVITDLRFENEAKWIKEQGGICIRVHSPTIHERDKGKSYTYDVSETALDSYEFDFYVDNPFGDMYTYFRNLDLMMKDLGYAVYS